MAEGRSKQLWGIASHVMAIVANCNRNAKDRPQPFMPRDFLPPEYQEAIHKQKTPDDEVPPETTFALMKSVFQPE